MAFNFRTFACVAFALLLAACQTSNESNFLPRDLAPAFATTDEQAWERLAELPWPQGGQRTYQSYDEARRVFWKKLYPDGGRLYCGVAFDGQRRDAVNEALSWSTPIRGFDAETEPGCTNRTCSVTRVQRAMADMQNLGPRFCA
jgi:hypothetical protein